MYHIKLLLFFDNKTLKYPYVCSTDNKLFKISDGEMTHYGKYNLEWNNIIINSQTWHFLNNYAMKLGYIFCENLSKIPSCQNPVNEKLNTNEMYC